MTIDIIEDAATNKVLVETQFQRFVEARALLGRPKKAKITHTSTPENIIDLVSMASPPSPTKVTEEKIPEQQSINQLNLYKSAMSEAVKEKFDRDRDLQDYIEKFPTIFTQVQKLSTKSPLFEVGGYPLPVPQTGQIPHKPNIFATITSTFEKNPEKEAEVAGCWTSTIPLTVPEPHLPATDPTRGEEEENIEDIN